MATPFLGVPDDIVRSLGELVIVAGKVEGTLRSISWSLALDPGNGQVKRVRKDARSRLVDKGVPPWARCSRDAVILWLDQLPQPFAKRDILVHGYALQQAREDGMVHISRHLRSGEQSDLDAEVIGALVSQFKNLQRTGIKLHGDLMILLTNGIIVSPWAPPGWGTISLRAGAGFWPQPPTQQQLDDPWRANSDA